MFLKALEPFLTIFAKQTLGLVLDNPDSSSEVSGDEDSEGNEGNVNTVDNRLYVFSSILKIHTPVTKKQTTS
jgi:hypothetical protein